MIEAFPAYKLSIYQNISTDIQWTFALCLHQPAVAFFKHESFFSPHWEWLSKSSIFLVTLSIGICTHLGRWFDNSYMLWAGWDWYCTKQLLFYHFWVLPYLLDTQKKKKKNKNPKCPNLNHKTYEKKAFFSKKFEVALRVYNR